MDKLRLAGCAIFSEEGILTLYRKTKSWYELPGGKIGEGESTEEAAIRELKEELCIDVQIVRVVGTMDFRQDEYVMEYNWLEAIIIAGEPQIGEPDTFDHFKWIRLRDMCKYQLSPNMENLVRYLNGNH